MMKSADNRQHAPLFSIIIPVYNAAGYAGDALDSVFSQTLPSDSYEVILVDDCSTDNTCDVLTAHKHHKNFRMESTKQNAGPGVARNVGISHATGQWILFLDSDDRLMPGALAELEQEIVCAEEADAHVDVIGFNWAFINPSDSITVPNKGLRKDHVYLTAGRAEMLRRYLNLQTDGSVIFTLVRRSLLLQHQLRFDAGLHEDVDFLFYLYWYANGFRFVDRVLYGKVQRSGSIVNTITERHLIGFLRAWKTIGRFIEAHGGEQYAVLQGYFLKGLVAVVATRVREIHRLSNGRAAIQLYHCLFDQCQSIMADLGLRLDLGLNTKYGILTSSFLDVMNLADVTDAAKAQRMSESVDSILRRSWSCIDLHHSVFLAPNQIRTCCKRFFREGKMSGDAVLTTVVPDQPVTSDDIATAKRHLYEAINKGDPTGCYGCPFLEFKEWGPIEPLSIHYLSMEYHSLCNLKCTYCSETYYGGAKANYDVPGLIDEFLTRGQLDHCHTVVWGGGEPVIEANFTLMINKMVERLPQAEQRVLTNSVKFSKTVAHLLTQDRLSITTSVDAGSTKTFEVVRGRPRLKEVMSHLKQYVALQPRRVTVKYIFTEENSTIEEVRGFLELVLNYELNGCSFQISTNFKEQDASLDSAVLMIAMYGLLVQAGHRAVFFDDLLRHRLTCLHAGATAEIHRRLQALGLAPALARYQDFPRVVIWGAGQQAKYMVENSVFLKHAEIIFFVDDTPGKIGTHYLGHDVRSPETLLHNDLPVAIAAVQGYPFIYDSLLRLGVAPSRLITGLIL